jgi:hypothetical protein
MYVFYKRNSNQGVQTVAAVIIRTPRARGPGPRVLALPGTNAVIRFTIEVATARLQRGHGARVNVTVVRTAHSSQGDRVAGDAIPHAHQARKLHL